MFKDRDGLPPSFFSEQIKERKKKRKKQNDKKELRRFQVASLVVTVMSTKHPLNWRYGFFSSAERNRAHKSITHQCLKQDDQGG